MFKLAKSHNWLIFSLIDPELEKRISQYMSGCMVDIGCGIKPYEHMASKYVDKHIGVDHSETIHDRSKIDIMGTVYNIPVDDNQFDCLLCTDVLEHLEEPSDALAESFRILKPGGYAIFTVPLFWHLHEVPRDFYRYTKYGLEYLFKKNGFDIVEIKAISGFCVTFAQEFVYFLYRFRKGGIINPLWWVIPILGMIIQSVAYILNKIDSSEDFTIEYIAVVKKTNTNNIIEM
uniref:Class I SAM-dependent methyltransferase n=1 Tax=Planktothricoides sp. SpSt-374 TaxID=2282167 RepID=A0A7C3VT81_9CYAN